MPVERFPTMADAVLDELDTGAPAAFRDVAEHAP